MRVLLLGPWPPPHGGVQTNLVAIRALLRERGVPCSVINVTRFRQPDHDGIYFPSNAAHLLALLARLKYSVVHLHFGGRLSPRLLALTLICSAIPRVRTVLTFHSGGYPVSDEGRASHPRTFRAFVFRRVDRLIAVNEQLRSVFVEQFGVPADRVRVIPPHALPASPRDVRMPDDVERFFQAHGPVLLSMGWLEPEYDFPLQIRALGEVRRTHPRAGLLILGEGRLEGELRAEIAATGYPGDVLLAGDLPHEIALAAIARCDVFLRTSHYDGDSISVREALHFGTPVVASDNGMRPDGVRLFPARDLGALVSAIDDRLRAGRKATAPAAGSRDHIEAVFNLYREITMECGGNQLSRRGNRVGRTL